MTRDDLIEKARVAFTEAWEAEDRRVETYDRDSRGTHSRSRAGINAALSVFAESLAPTGDDREALDKIKLAGHLAAQTMVFQGETYPVKALPYTSFLQILDGFRRSEVPEPSVDRVELAAATIAVAELVRSHRTWGDLLDVQKDEYRRVAREVLRATDALTEPQGEPSDRSEAARRWAARTPIGPESAPVQAFEAGWDARGRVQGEPSNAEVQAFVSAINGEGFVLDRLAVRVGLRAAAAVRGTGGEQ